MTKWDHRLIRSKSILDANVTSIHEVYYDEEGNPFLKAAHPVVLEASDREKLRETYELLASAFDKPVLFPEDFKD